jgi:hypothetical protein
MCFFFSNLPITDVMTINLFRENEKKKKKERYALIGELSGHGQP